MNKKDCYFLGHIVRPTGLKGVVSAKLDVDNLEDYINLESVFLDIKGNLIPFFITDLQIRGEEFASIHFDGIKDIASAQNLCGAEMYLPLSVLPKLSGTAFYFHEVLNYTVLDKTHGDIGKIECVVDNIQPLLQIFKGKIEILIPIADPIITMVDRENQTLHIDAPEGLIDIYLQQ